MGSRGEQDDPPEWTFLTFDTDATCSVCGDAIHSGQAVGRIRGELMHAKCYRPAKPA